MTADIHILAMFCTDGLGYIRIPGIYAAEHALETYYELVAMHASWMGRSAI